MTLRNLVLALAYAAKENVGSTVNYIHIHNNSKLSDLSERLTKIQTRLIEKGTKPTVELPHQRVRRLEKAVKFLETRHNGMAKKDDEVSKRINKLKLEISKLKLSQKGIVKNKIVKKVEKKKKIVAKNPSVNKPVKRPVKKSVKKPIKRPGKKLDTLKTKETGNQTTVISVSPQGTNAKNVVIKVDSEQQLSVELLKKRLSQLEERYSKMPKTIDVKTATVKKRIKELKERISTLKKLK